MKPTPALLFFGVLIFASALILAEELANSGYPVNKANNERNNQINRALLCSAISQGKTTVFSNTWSTSTATYRLLDGLPPILESARYAYLSATGYILKLNLETRLWEDYLLWDRATCTATKSGFTFFSASGSTVAFNSTMDYEIIAENAVGGGFSSMIPFGSDLMVRTNVGIADSDVTDSAFTLLNVTERFWSQDSPAFNVGAPREAMIYKNDTELLIIVGYSSANSNNLITIRTHDTTYQRSVTGRLHAVDPFIVDGKLAVFLENNVIAYYNPQTGAPMGTKSWDVLGQTFMDKSMMIKGSKALASLYSYDKANNYIVEINTNTTIISGRKFAGNPTFSLVDNAVLMTLADENGDLELRALDWNNLYSVKAIGLFENLPPAVNVTRAVSEAVIGENCNVHVVVDGALYTFEPLPLQNVIPVLDCIDQNNVAHFSYEISATNNFRLPFVADRNNLEPLSTTPMTYFDIAGAPHYPLGFKVQLGSNTSTVYRWVLEDYALTFSHNAALACPTGFNLTMKFRAQATFTESFADIVLDAFANVTGIRVSRLRVARVTISNAKRSVYQSDSTLELELEISPGDQSEPSAGDIVSDFIDNQQGGFIDKVTSNPYAPSGVQLDGISTDKPANAQQGIPNPPIAPTAPTASPVNPPVEPPMNEPVGQPSADVTHEPLSQSRAEVLVPAIVIPVVGVAAAIFFGVYFGKKAQAKKNEKEPKSSSDDVESGSGAVAMKSTATATGIAPSAYSTVPAKDRASGQYSNIPKIDDEYDVGELEINPTGINPAEIDKRMHIPYKSLVFTKEIGAGSYGKVFLGEWRGAEVAIKVNNTVTDMEGFLAEAKLTLGITPHPNLVQTFGVSLDGSYPCIVLEFCGGGSLDKLLFNNASTMTDAKRKEFALKIAYGLIHLHNNSIVHRDLAARNILLSTEGQPKISDFGMSRIIQDEDSKGKTKTNVGPLRWMPIVEALQKNPTVIKVSIRRQNEDTYNEISPNEFTTQERAAKLSILIERKGQSPAHLIANKRWDELAAYIKDHSTEYLAFNLHYSCQVDLSTKTFIDSLAIQSLQPLLEEMRTKNNEAEVALDVTKIECQSLTEQRDKLRKQLDDVEIKLAKVTAQVKSDSKDLEDRKRAEQDLQINLQVFQASLRTNEPALQKWQKKLQVDIAEWSCEDVLFLLSDIGLQKYSTSFSANKIDGAVLLTLDASDLTATLELTFKDAKKLQMYIYLVQTRRDIYTIPAGVLQWNNDTVCTWLEDNKFGHLVDVFRKHQITGAELAFLEKLDLTHHLQIKALGDVVKLQKEIAILKDSLSETQALARSNANNNEQSAKVNNKPAQDEDQKVQSPVPEFKGFASVPSFGFSSAPRQESGPSFASTSVFSPANTTDEEEIARRRKIKYRIKSSNDDATKLGQQEKTSAAGASPVQFGSGFSFAPVANSPFGSGFGTQNSAANPLTQPTQLLQDNSVASPVQFGSGFSFAPAANSPFASSFGTHSPVVNSSTQPQPKQLSQDNSVTSPVQFGFSFAPIANSPFASSFGTQQPQPKQLSLENSEVKIRRFSVPESDHDEEGDKDNNKQVKSTPLLLGAPVQNSEKDPKFADRTTELNASDDESEEAPICPITHDVMKEPVVASDGHTYERTAIELWLKNNNTSPMTGLQLSNKQLTPVQTMDNIGANKK